MVIVCRIVPREPVRTPKKCTIKCSLNLFSVISFFGFKIIVSATLHGRNNAIPLMMLLSLPQPHLVSTCFILAPNKLFSFPEPIMSLPSLFRPSLFFMIKMTIRTPQFSVMLRRKFGGCWNRVSDDSYRVN